MVKQLVGTRFKTKTIKKKRGIKSNIPHLIAKINNNEMKTFSKNGRKKIFMCSLMIQKLKKKQQKKLVLSYSSLR